MGKTLFILKDPPYGSERVYNSLRLAGTLAKREGEAIRVFLIGDAAVCAKRGQEIPQGQRSCQAPWFDVVALWVYAGHAWTRGASPRRSVTAEELSDGTHRSTMEELADWTLWADRVLVS